MPLIWCSISGHGYGHAAQVVPVLNALGRLVPNLKALLRTTVPAGFFEPRLAIPWELSPAQQDIGCIQKGPLTIDVAGTWVYGYFRDRCLFSDVIDIEDSVSVNVKYAKGAVMSYSLTAHSPYECMKLVINGVKGRLEADTALGKETIKFYNRDGECVNFDRTHVKQRAGGHGGSDPAMRDNLFRGFTEDPLGQMADTRAGAMSIGIGIAANKSMKEDRAVYLSEFLGKYYTPGKK